MLVNTRGRHTRSTSRGNSCRHIAQQHSTAQHDTVCVCVCVCGGGGRDRGGVIVNGVLCIIKVGKGVQGREK